MKARSLVDGLARDRHVVGVRDPVEKPQEHPPGDQGRLGGDHRLEQCRMDRPSTAAPAVAPGERRGVAACSPYMNIRRCAPRDEGMTAAHADRPANRVSRWLGEAPFPSV
jgi:hypothetical protein